MRLVDALLGRPLRTSEAEEQKIGVWAGIPFLGLDALASAAYGPEAALTILIPLGAAGLAYEIPISIVILIILAILTLSYRQTIDAYPSGGGSYTVAKENLGVTAGLFAAAALMLDYVLDVAVGISAGVGALVSAVPSLHPHTLGLCLVILLLLVVVNLRGVRETGVLFALPTYLFIFCLLSVIVWGGVQVFLTQGHPVAIVPPSPMSKSTETVSIWLILRAFASGCTAMTGVEAVSNGVQNFRQPVAKTAQKTLVVICSTLGVLLLGVALISKFYNIGATDPTLDSYQSVLSQMTAAVVGRGPAYYITLGSVLAVLALSANTGFADFPRLTHLLADDRFLPRFFAIRGRRLVYSFGILVLGLIAALLLIAFGGVTDRLIPLFAVGAFLAFTLSQAGMVVHWHKRPKRTGMHEMINGVGAVSTGVALVVVAAAKFVEGAWVTILLMPALVFMFYRVRLHYDRIASAVHLDRAFLPRNPTPPIVLVPVREWNLISEKALNFALGISNEIEALHIRVDEEKTDQFLNSWERLVSAPCRARGLPEPNLMVVNSPYRRVVMPLLDHALSLSRSSPDRTIAVIIPEIQERGWTKFLLHNQTAAALKAGLLFNGTSKIVVINVPWYMKDAGQVHPDEK
jgi:amino acid transporter